MASINFEHVTKRYGDGLDAVKEMNLAVADGELMVLVGPSGSGKSTALRMVAGLEDITADGRGGTCSAPDGTAKRRRANATSRRGLATVAARRTPSCLTAGADTNPAWTADRVPRAAQVRAEAVPQAFVTPHARGIRKRLLEAIDAWDSANDPARAAAEGAKGTGGFTRSDWQ